MRRWPIPASLRAPPAFTLYPPGRYSPCHLAHAGVDAQAHQRACDQPGRDLEPKACIPARGCARAPRGQARSSRRGRRPPARPRGVGRAQSRARRAARTAARQPRATASPCLPRPPSRPVGRAAGLRAADRRRRARRSARDTAVSRAGSAGSGSRVSGAGETISSRARTALRSSSRASTAARRSSSDTRVPRHRLPTNSSICSATWGSIGQPRRYPG